MATNETAITTGVDEPLLDPERLAGYLSTRITQDGMAALYMLIQDDVDALLLALGSRLQVMAETTTDTGLQYGQVEETFNDKHYAAVVAARRADVRKREAIELDALNDETAQCD